MSEWPQLSPQNSTAHTRLELKTNPSNSSCRVAAQFNERTSGNGAVALWFHVQRLSRAAVVVVTLCLVLMHAFTVGEIRRPHVIHVKNTLREAYMDKAAGVIFTNRYPRNCRVFDYTNHFLIAGTNFQCVLAADSWDYQGASNLLALTTSKMFLYIDKHGAVLASHYPPGYDSFP